MTYLFNTFDGKFPKEFVGTFFSIHPFHKKDVLLPLLTRNHD